MPLHDTPTTFDSLICCPLTPPGVGAIAVIALCGDKSWSIVCECVEGFKTKLPESPQPGRLYFGKFYDDTEAIDEVILAPQHGSAGNVVGVDISGHGGIRVVERILMMLTERGASLVPPDSVASCNPTNDGMRATIAADAMRRLIRATTRRAARFLMLQIELLPIAYIEIIDAAKCGNVNNARAKLQALIEQSNRAANLLTPPKISVIGPPNAGKSSLVNALSGRGEVIVSDTEGTTRDWVTVAVVIDGVGLTLIDTAGLRDAPTSLEDIAIARGRSAAKESSLRICVIDRSTATRADLDDAASKVETNDIFVANKSDLPAARDWAVFAKFSTANVIEISASTGDGIDHLRAAIVRRIGLSDFDDQAAAEFNADRLGKICNVYRTNANSSTSLAEQIEGIFVRGS